MTTQETKEETDIPVDSYRVIRRGFGDYWLERWDGCHWWPVWPYITRWGAVRAAKRKAAERDHERGIVEHTIWEESH